MTKSSELFSNISACKYSSKTVQCSKWTIGWQVSKEADTNHGGFWFLEESGKTPGAIFLKHFRWLHHGFCLFFPKVKSCGLRYLKKHVWTFGQSLQCCNLFETLYKIAPWFLFIFSKNRKNSKLGSVSVETRHPMVHFDYWTFFEGYLGTEIFEK